MTSKQPDIQPKPNCFVISPIGEIGSEIRTRADKVLRHIIRKALEPEYNIRRADEVSNPGAISPRMIQSILDADLVVADMTGLNPNVFYEIAIAHGFRKPTVHIQSVGEKIAFDVKDMNTIRFDITDIDDVEKAQSRLRDYSRHAVEQPETVETPLTGAQRFSAVQTSTDPVAESNVQVMDALSALRREVRTLARPRGAKPVQSVQSAQIRGMRKIVNRIVDSGRAEAPDFAETISPITSKSYDEWLRRRLSSVVGHDDRIRLNDILLDEETKTGLEEINYIEDGDPDDFDLDD